MPENLFEKIDKQSEAIDSVAEKLDGVSIDDLYALAKRTWDYKDYQTAQKYFNHISLLKPLDWKAPYYASLCNCMMVDKSYDECERLPKTVCRYFDPTVDYIVNRNLPNEEKENAIEEIINITLSVFKEYIRIYRFPKNNFDRWASEFKRELQKAFIDTIRKVDGIPFIKSEIKDYLCLECAEFIETDCQKDKSICITKQDYEKYILPYNDRINYEEAIYEEPDPEKEKEIKLKGKCYLEYKDKVIERRYRRNNLIFGIILLLSGSLDILLTCESYMFVVGLLIGLLVIGISAIMLTRGLRPIRQDSLINHDRWKYRLSSNGDVICEEVFSPIKILLILFPFLYPFSQFLVIALFSDSIGSNTETVFLIKIILLAVTSLAGLVVLIISIGTNYISRYECRKKFIYKGKTYYF